MAPDPTDTGTDPHTFDDWETDTDDHAAVDAYAAEVAAAAEAFGIPAP